MEKFFNVLITTTSMNTQISKIVSINIVFIMSRSFVNEIRHLIYNPVGLISINATWKVVGIYSYMQ